MITGNTLQSSEYHLIPEQFAAAPGIDPVIAALEKREDQIPTSGYLVDCKLYPSEMGSVSITHYIGNDARPGLVITGSNSVLGTQYAYADVHESTQLAVVVTTRKDKRWEDDPEDDALAYYEGLKITHATTRLLASERNRSMLVTKEPRQRSSSEKCVLSITSGREDNATHEPRVVRTLEEVQGLMEAMGAFMQLNAADAKTLVEVTMRKLGHMESERTQRDLVTLQEQLNKLSNWWPVRILGAVGLGPRK